MPDIIRKTSLISSLVILISLVACELPASYAPDLPDNNQRYTQAASTIAAHLTSGAETGIETPEPNPPTSPIPDETPEDIPETLPATSTPLPTKTPLPSQTNPPTETDFPSTSVTATHVGDLLKSELGKPTWVDSFEDSANWPIYQDEHVSMNIKNGRLEMNALKADKWESWMVTWDQVEDFYLETNTKTGDCSGLDRYGMLVRASKTASQAYLYGITCDGRYSLRIWDGESFTSLIGWTESKKINAGSKQTNLLGFMAEGEVLSLYANGERIDQVQDKTFSEGAFGLFIGAFNTPDFQVRFEDITLWELPE